MKLCILIFAIFISLFVGACEYEWLGVTQNAPFIARDGAGGLSYNGRMYLIGGWNPVQFYRTTCNDVWAFDGYTWEKQKHDNNVGWEPRHSAGYCIHDGYMWIVGGDGNQGHYQYDVWRSTTGHTWEQVTNSVPWGPRLLHYCVSHDGYIWVMGGQTIPPIDGQPEEFYRDIWRSEDGVNWEQITPEEPYWYARGAIAGAAVKDGKIWIIGGGTYETPQHPTRTYYNDVWSSQNGIEWTCVCGSAPWAPREYQSVAVWDDKLWIVAGYNGSNLNEVWYSSDGVKWCKMKGIPWTARHAATLIVHDDSLWLMAGTTQKSDAWRLVRSQ